MSITRSPPMNALKIACDSCELLSLLQAATEAVDGTLQPFEGSFRLVEALQEPVSIEADHDAALAGELVVRLNPSDGLRRLMAALLAWDGDLLAVEDTVHGAPP